jgi:hypothetical protein
LGVQLRLQGVKFNDYFLYDPSIQLLDLFSDLSPEEPAQPNVGWVAAIVIGILAGAIASLAIPQVRAKVMPFFSRSSESFPRSGSMQSLTANEDKNNPGWSVAKKPTTV